MFQQIRKEMGPGWFVPLSLLMVIFGFPVLVFFLTSRYAIYDDPFTNAFVTLFVLCAVLGIPFMMLVYRSISIKWPKPVRKSMLREKLAAANVTQQAQGITLLIWFMFFLWFVRSKDTSTAMVTIPILFIPLFLYVNIFLMQIVTHFLIRWGWAIKIGPGRKVLRAKRAIKRLWAKRFH